jgi:hypothetical protein
VNKRRQEGLLLRDEDAEADHRRHNQPRTIETLQSIQSIEHEMLIDMKRRKRITRNAK